MLCLAAVQRYSADTKRDQASQYAMQGDRKCYRSGRGGLLAQGVGVRSLYLLDLSVEGVVSLILE